MPIRVLFVCLGNICRSPLAEGAFRTHLKNRNILSRFVVDSAGTGGYHAGEKPDPRSIKIAREMGVEISQQRSRKLELDDYQNFDYIIAMDRSNLRDINARKPTQATSQVTLMLDELGAQGQDVPDPYYGGPSGFKHVWNLVDRATHSLLDRILNAPTDSITRLE